MVATKRSSKVVTVKMRVTGAALSGGCPIQRTLSMLGVSNGGRELHVASGEKSLYNHTQCVATLCVSVCMYVYHTNFSAALCLFGDCEVLSELEENSLSRGNIHLRIIK